MATVELIPFTPGGGRPTRRAIRGWARATRSRSCSATGRSTTAATCCSRSTGSTATGYALDVTLRADAARVGTAADRARRVHRGRTRPLARGRSATIARTCSRSIPDELDCRDPVHRPAPRAEIRLTRDGAVEGVTDGTLRRLRRQPVRLAVRRASSSGCCSPDAERQGVELRLPPVVSGAADRLAQGRALHARADRRRRPQAPQPRRSRVAGAGRALPRAAHLPRASSRRSSRSLLSPRGAARSSTAGTTSSSTSRAGSDVWGLRESLRRPRTGRCALNLLDKRRATLEFLHVHHEDLKHAIELAGANHTNAQETWHRVFRDAERAVLRQTQGRVPRAAATCPPEVRRFVLWHRRGHVGLERALRVPGPLPRLLGDQDGLFASACNQYRASMNHVADWAQRRGLMDHTRRGVRPAPGEPARGAHEPADPGRRCCRRATAMTRRAAEGRRRPAAGLRAAARRPARADRRHAAVRAAARRRDRPARAHRAAADVRADGADHRPGPARRVAVRGRRGRGRGDAAPRDGIEVNLGTPAARRGARRDVAADRRSRAARPCARSTGALVYEIGRRQYEPILAARPELVDALERAMEARLRTQGEVLERYDADRARAGFTRRIRRLLTSA